MYNSGEGVRSGEGFCGFASGVVNKKLGPMMVPDEVPSIFDWSIPEVNLSHLVQYYLP